MEELKTHGDTRSKRLFGLLWPGMVVALCIWFGHSGLVTLYANISLSLHGKTTMGWVMSADEDVDDADDGRAIWTTHVEYGYRTRDGKTHTATEMIGGRCPSSWGDQVRINVEYLPYQDDTSRIAGTGRDQIGQGLFCLIMSIIGLALTLHAIDREP